MNETARRCSGTRLPLSALCALAFLSTSWAAETSSVPKDHALFVGTSLQVECDGAFLELAGARGKEVTVLAEGQARSLPRSAVKAVRLESGLKLSSLVAQIDNLKTTTLKAAPTGDRFAADRARILMDSLIDQNEDIMDNSQRNVEAVRAGLSNSSDNSRTDAQQILDRAEAAYARAVTENPRLQGSVGSFALGDLEKTAVEVVCDLSCPRDTRDAYALLVTEFRTSSREKPEARIHIEPLRGLGPKPQRVTMLQTGLPPGFELGRVAVHVYADGQELATNLSEQRVDLTADDALRYLVLCYVASHRTDTLSAAPLKVTLPVDFKQQTATMDLTRPIYVTVGPDGIVQKSALDSVGQAALEPYLDTVVRKFRFNPALAAGKPIESVVELKLADFVP